MLKFVALALSFVSVQAFACPKLAGTYNCAYQDGSSEVVSITQADKNGGTVFSYDSSEMPADNQTYPLDERSASGMLTTVKSATFRAWCDLANPNLLHIQLIGQYWETDRHPAIHYNLPYESPQTAIYLGDLTINITFAMVGQDLKQTTHGTLKKAGSEYPFDSEMVCTRK